MKNFIIPIAAFVLLVALCYTGYALYNKSKQVQELEARLDQPSSGVPLEAEIIARKVDEKGLHHAIIEDAQPILRTIELKVEDKRKVDSLTKLLGITSESLKSVTIAKTAVENQNFELKRVISNRAGEANERDTFFMYKDPWWNIAVYDSTETTKRLNLSYNFDFTSVSYDPRPWYKKPFTPEVTYTDIHVSDPRSTIRGVQKLTIKQPVDKFDLKFKASGQMHRNTLSLGPKLELRVGRVSGSGTYSYYPEFKEWKPSFSLDFEFGGF